MDINYKGLYKTEIIIRGYGHWPVRSMIMDQWANCVCFCSLLHSQCFAKCQGHSGLLVDIWVNEWKKVQTNEQMNKWMTECKAKPTGPSHIVCSLFIPHSHSALIYCKTKKTETSRTALKSIPHLNHSPNNRGGI